MLVALVLGTDNHYLAVSFNYLALVAHRFYRRSYFHIYFSSRKKLFTARELYFANLKGAAFPPAIILGAVIAALRKLNPHRAKNRKLSCATQIVVLLATFLF